VTLEQIRIFMAVVEQGGVNAASKVLSKTQPAISNAIAKLEEDLNVTLFSREGYRLTLNAQGHALAAQMVSILEQTARLKADALYLSGGNEPEIRISLEGLAPIAPLGNVLGSLTDEFPHTRFHLRSDIMGGAFEKLADETVDFAVGSLLDGRHDFESKRIATTKLVAVGAPDSVPFATPHQPLTKTHLAKAVQIVVQDTTQQERGNNLAISSEDRPLFVANSAMKKQLIIEGLGWGFVPLHLVQRELDDGVLSRLEIEGVDAREIDIFALRKRSRPLGPAGRRLWQAFCDLSQGGSHEQHDQGL
jgi:DNA-binding transcriptional LysR family regulator